MDLLARQLLLAQIMIMFLKTGTSKLVFWFALGTFAVAGIGVDTSSGQAAEHPQVNTERTQYQINLALDFDHRSYIGSERVRWTNSGITLYRRSSFTCMPTYALTNQRRCGVIGEHFRDRG